MTAPAFPPLFEGEGVAAGIDPFDRAKSRAMLGCDAGLVVHHISADRLQAAIVFAPEVDLAAAMPVFIACGIGFQNALGALAPPEVAVHLAWQGGIFVNGARCGRLRVAAAEASADEVPEWIVVGLDLPLIPADDSDPGAQPDETCLYEEGCVEVDPITLLEAWVRHTLVWVNRMEDDGLKPLNAEWRGLAQSLGESVSVTLADETLEGTFVGVDETFGMLLRQGEAVTLLPLSRLLEKD